MCGKKTCRYQWILQYKCVRKKKKRYAGTQTDLPSDPLTCQNKIFYMDVVKMLKRHSIKLQIIPKIRGPQDVITILPNQQGLKTD